MPSPLPPVRALTLGLAGRHPLDAEALAWGAELLRSASGAVAGAGYEVQTLRLSSRPLLADMPGCSQVELDGYLGWLQDELDRLGVAFMSLGPVGAVPAQLARVPELAAMLAPRPALNWSVMVAEAGGRLDVAAAEQAGRAMALLAGADEEGLGNFRFAATACVRPGTPFFPAAYHDGPPALSVALQGAGVLALALGGGASLGEVSARVAQQVEQSAAPVVELCRAVCGEAGAAFAGVDLSPAPGPGASVVAALEEAGLGPFGGPGTLALCAAVTSGLQSTSLPTCGYCGLMLPVMEDPVLAGRWEEGRVGLDQLLTYSAVCGTGLDTVPVPGGTSPSDLARVVADMASLAVRYSKPLSARLMPVPGASPGQLSRFSSPYLVNTVVKPVSG